MKKMCSGKKIKTITTRKISLVIFCKYLIIAYLNVVSIQIVIMQVLHLIRKTTGRCRCFSVDKRRTPRPFCTG